MSTVKGTAYTDYELKCLHFAEGKTSKTLPFRILFNPTNRYMAQRIHDGDVEPNPSKNITVEAMEGRHPGLSERACIDQREEHVKAVLVEMAERLGLVERFKWSNETLFVYTDEIPEPKVRSTTGSKINRRVKKRSELNLCSVKGAGKVSAMYVRGGYSTIQNDIKDELGNPCYDIDIVVHEMIHCLSFWFRERKNRVLTPEVEGVDECFCDYFAYAFTKPLKESENRFQDLIGSVLVRKWVDVTFDMEEGSGVKARITSKKHVKDTSESTGEHNRFGKRDYSKYVATTAKWESDEHHWGRKLCYGFLSLRASVKAAKSFDNFVFDLHPPLLR